MTLEEFIALAKTISLPPNWWLKISGPEKSGYEGVRLEVISLTQDARMWKENGHWWGENWELIESGQAPRTPMPNVIKVVTWYYMSVAEAKFHDVSRMKVLIYDWLEEFHSHEFSEYLRFGEEKYDDPHPHPHAGDTK